MLFSRQQAKSLGAQYLVASPLAAKWSGIEAYSFCTMPMAGICFATIHMASQRSSLEWKDLPERFCEKTVQTCSICSNQQQALLPTEPNVSCWHVPYSHVPFVRCVWWLCWVMVLKTTVLSPASPKSIQSQVQFDGIQ